MIFFTNLAYQRVKTDLTYKLYSLIDNPTSRKIMRIGIIMMVILTTTVQLLSAKLVKGQTVEDVEISLELKNASLLKAFKRIEAQSSFHFMYRVDDVKAIDKIDIPASKKSVAEFLRQMLSNTTLSYKQLDDRILIVNRAKVFALNEDGAAVTKLNVNDIVVRGRVTDNSGAPLPGVGIKVKGSTMGTSTDIDGRYSLTVIDPNTVLIFSFIGFTTQEVSVNGRTTLDVRLEEEAMALNTVVVTALGITRAVKSLTYAVEDISGDKLNEAKETNIINTLQGKIAGVNITKNANGPGGDAKVIIRGNRSITGNNQPLYVIDGVPLNGGIGMLNSDDVESMTVLKGASAAALYGSQGQNGAIIITTKRGKTGAIAVNYTGGFAVDQAAVLPELQYEYGQGDAGLYNAASEHSWGPKATGQTVTLWNGNSVPLTGQKDRLKDFFRLAQNLTNTVSLTGGGEKMQTYFSYGSTEAQGIMRNNDLSRHNVDLKIDNQVSSRLSFFSKLTYIYENVNNRLIPGEGGTYALPSMYRAPTSIPASEMQNYSYIDAAGTEKQSYWKPGSSILLNPYWALNRVLYYQETDRVIGLVSGKYDFNDWLNIQVRGSIDKTLFKSDNKIYADNYFSLVGSNYNYSNTMNQGSNIDVLLSFKRDLSSRFNISGNIGGALQQGSYSSVNGNANGLNKSNFFFMNNAKAPFITDSFGKKPQVQSVYGTGTLAYNNYMYLDVTLRNDWSSALPKSSQSYFYPSVGLSAILSDMLTLPSWVNYGKARVTYANSGYGGQEYLDRNYYTVNPGGAIITPTIQSLGDYKPELTTSFEFGLDWRFANNRLGFNATYYDTKTKNQLLLIGTPSATLFNQKYINAGLIQNKGIELVVDGTPVKGTNLTWDAGVNFSKNINKIVRLTDAVKSAILVDDRASQIRAEEGGSFGDMYVKDWMKDAQGRRLIDANGLPVLTAGRDVFLGNYNPDFMMGITNSLSFKNLSLSFLVDYREGGYVIGGTQALIDADGHSKRSLEGRESGLVLDGYTADGQKNTKVISAQTYWSTIGDRYPTGGLYAYSATNIRMREMVLGYRLPKAVFGASSFIKDAKLSLVGRNLFFFYKDAPIDPEITLGINGGGLEYGALPSTRTMGLNLKLTF